MLGLIAVVLLVVHLTLKYWKVHRIRQRLPPGPPPLPVFGNLWEINFSVQEDTLEKFAKVYGNVFTLWMKESPMVVVNGFNAVKNGLTTHPEDFSLRPVSPFYRYLTKKKGQPCDPWFSLCKAVMNVISAVVLGHRFSEEDGVFERLMELAFSFNGGGSPYKLYDLFPWLMYYLPGPHQQKFYSYECIRSYLKQEIKIHKANGTPSEPGDFIDCYLEQIDKNGRKPGSTFDEANMIQSITDLYTGALETTATTLHWALLYMVAYPDVQDKVRKELEDVFGGSQTISYEERERLPYTNAVIHEIQRLSKVIITSFRCCTRDTEVHGFPVKKGTMTLFNIGSVLCDPNQWKNPQQFDPTNFLDDSGKFMNREAFLPFAAGHRVCLGEKLARTELFVFFVSLMRTFTFQLPKEVEQISTQPILGRIISHPQSYQLCAVPC